MHVSALPFQSIVVKVSNVLPSTTELLEQRQSSYLWGWSDGLQIQKALVGSDMVFASKLDIP